MTAVRTLFSEAVVAARVAELAREIAATLPAEITIVAVLKGSFVLVADLARALSRLHRAPRIEFIRLSSYGDARESAGHVSLAGDLPAGLEGRAVLLIDDILDTGRTLTYAAPLLTEQGASRVWTCVLVDKPSRREVDFAPDFVGFTVPDVFVVGYGIDHAEQHRELPFIGTID